MGKTIGELVHLDVPRALEMVGDEASVRDILRMAEQGLRRDLLQMAQSLRAGDVAAVRQVLHTLKGSLPIFCADPLTEQVRAIEQLCKTADAVQVASVFAGVAQELARLADEIQVHLESLAS
jgi:HPt (histidine-containing phosphotransfer) domain-containing protein